MNLKHDVEIIDAAKNAFITEVTNEATKEAIVTDFLADIKDGAPIEVAVEKQELPFEVTTPAIKDADEAPEETLHRMVCRNGVCTESIKDDPEFNDFLSNLITGRGKGQMQLSSLGKGSAIAMPTSFDIDAFF